METIDQLLLEVKEDKCDNLTTTSFKFKRDVYEYFSDTKYRDKTCIEFGTHKGQTTRILSELFSKVITINVSEESLLAARELNKDKSNIIYIPFDLYTEPLEKQLTDEVISVALIDAGHLYDNVVSDVTRLINLNVSTDCEVIFDDYGLIPDVHRAINDLAFSEYLEITKNIGHEKNYNFGGTPNRILNYGSEGIICKLKELNDE